MNRGYPIFYFTPMLEAVRLTIVVIITAIVGFIFGVKSDKVVPQTPKTQLSIPTQRIQTVSAAVKPQAVLGTKTPLPIVKPTSKPKPVAQPKPVAALLQPTFGAYAPDGPQPIPVVPQDQPVVPAPVPPPEQNPTPTVPPPPPAPAPVPPTTLSPLGYSLTGHNYGKCPIFPADHPYNTDISSYPIHPRSDQYMTKLHSIATRNNIHPDFGGKGENGMPVNFANNNTPRQNIEFTAYGASSDPGPYPIPNNLKVQPNDDRHVTILDTDNCKLYEMFYAWPNGDGSWRAHAGVIWDVTRDHRRPFGWTSADGAGMAIFPLVVKYDEVKNGSVNHAIRMTVPKTYKGWIFPANHQAGVDDIALPPMGLRFRLKAEYDISGFPYEARVILTAMKKYGMLIAQNGSSWVIGGEQDPRWNDDHLRTIKSVPSSALEVVYTGEIQTKK